MSARVFTRRLGTVMILVLVAVAASGCSAEPRLADVAIADGAPVVVELAETAAQQKDGLSGRDELAVGTGMLFRFEGNSTQEMWMAGMTFPLDVAWISNGKIVAVDSLAPCTAEDQATCPRWVSPLPVDGLLEVPAGELEGVIPGMDVSIAERNT